MTKRLQWSEALLCAGSTDLRGCVARRVVTGGESAQAVTSGEGQGVEPEYGPSGSWESSSAEGLVSGWATERARWTSVRCVIS